MYNYEIEKDRLLTDAGQRMFLKIRDMAFKLHDLAGAFTVSKVIGGVGGDSFLMLACIDRLVELSEFQYVFTDCATQHRVLVKR